jgi:3-deoxy-D-manno-octulosonic-acid transferase|tara:strand:+ start:315 stop:1580 length:1266 start_codon:yes stop_codon:yes gene_type:complete
MIFIYSLFINLIFIISPIIFFFRLLKKKEDPNRFKEKLCFFSKKRSKGNLVWFHGASVGEILSVIPLIEKLEKNKKINQILVTTNTLSSSKILANIKLKKTVHQFFPIDTNFHSKRFLDYWKPKTVFFIDSEIWPNMITNIKKRNISLGLINARITKKTFNKWKFFISSSKTIFSKFDLCLSSNFESIKHLKLLGAKKIKYIGNLKFAQTEKKEIFLNNIIKNKLISRMVWCAASTHNTEEKICAIAHRKLRTKYKDLLTIIIPRHINRTNKIIEEMEQLNLKVHTHKSKKNIDADTDIYLVNSYGQSKPFFKFCKTVFLGGSLIKHGGQNPLEPAMYGCKILHGPNVSNFREVYSLLKQHKVSHKVNSLKEIINNVDKLFKDKTSSQNIKIKIKHLGNKILNLTSKEVNLLLVKNDNKKT